MTEKSVWPAVPKDAPHIKCVYCGHDLIVAGEDCQGCGKPCIESIFDPKYLAERGYPGYPKTD